MNLILERAPPQARRSVGIEEFGELTAISRMGGQGRVHRPERVPPGLGGGPVVVKLYRRLPPDGAAEVLEEMVSWSRSIGPAERVWLRDVAAWPLGLVSSGGVPVGIVMRDLGPRFTVPFLMPSGRSTRVLLAMEHLLGSDAYLQQRGLGLRLDTMTRAAVAERISAALGFLHRHAIVVSDLAPTNLLVAFPGGAPAVGFIDCDSMVFRGRQALTAVETGDWNMPAAFAEPAGTRAADAYKLGLVVLRLFSRSHDTRALAPHLRYVPVELRDLLYRALDRDSANRPPAGEWQRSLSKLLAQGGLNERYPPPAPPRAAARVPGAQPSQAPRVRAPVPTLARAPMVVAARPARNEWLRRGVLALWLVAGTIVLFLLFSRLFAAAIPSTPSGAGSPGALQGEQNTPSYYYGAPGGQGQAAPQQLP